MTSEEKAKKVYAELSDVISRNLMPDGIDDVSNIAALVLAGYMLAVRLSITSCLSKSEMNTGMGLMHDDMSRCDTMMDEAAKHSKH